jgi:putative nucleotidyltransferase-like protein
VDSATGLETDEALGAAVAHALRGSWRVSPPPLAIPDELLARLVPVLLASGAAGLVCRRLDRSVFERGGARVLHDAYRSQALGASMRELEIAAAVSHLRSHGVEALLIKGWAAARAYAEPGLRPPGDIDLCVRKAHLETARAALRAAGTRLTVDLHADAPSYADRTADDLFARSEVVEVAGADVRIPCPEDHLRLMCLHLLRHGAWRPVWLCDVAAAVEGRAPGFRWQECLAGDPRRTKAVACVIGLATRVLGADPTGTPRETREDELPRWLEPAVLRQWGAGAGASARGPLAHRMSDLIRRPLRLREELRLRWRNPIQASFELAAPFNSLPRLPFQLAATLLRAPDFLRQIAERPGRVRARRA